MTLSVVGFVIGSKLLIENVMGVDTQAAVTAWLAGAGAGTALTIAALLASDVFLPVPSSLVMVLSGAAFGVVRGSLIAPCRLGAGRNFFAGRALLTRSPRGRWRRPSCGSTALQQLGVVAGRHARCRW